MSRRANVHRHGANHAPGGSDPLGPIDSTENRGTNWGVRSVDPDDGNETLGYVLTATGDGGSSWRPTGLLTPFYDVVADLANTHTLLAYWRFGESASPFADTSGHPNGPANAVRTATGTAMTEDVTGALPVGDDDGAIQFNADNTTGDYLDVSDPGTPRLNLNATHSIGGFVKAHSSANTFLGTIVHQWVTSGSVDCGYLMYVSYPSLAITYIRRDTGSVQGEVASALVAGEWSLVFATYSAANGHRLYLNGALVDTDATSVTGPTFNFGPWFAQPTGLTLGNKPFYGALDEWSAWGSELTASDIARLWEASQIAPDPSDALADHLADTTDAHDASAISVLDTAGNFTGTDVEAVLAELADPANATKVWMPLADSTGILVLDADDNIIPTLIPL